LLCCRFTAVCAGTGCGFRRERRLQRVRYLCRKQENGMLWIAILFALAAGAGNPLQAGANAELNRVMGHPVLAALWVYLSGLAGVVLLALVLRPFVPATLDRLAGSVTLVPWWAWLGGAISIGSTITGLMLAQRLGSGVFTALSVTAAILMSVLLDQFGWAGFRQHAASPLRLAGCCFLVAGVWLVARS
jgi:transporter family-2 protein